MQNFKSIIISLSCILCSFYSIAQTATLNGKVMEDDGMPISDVTINISNTNKFVLSDSLGNFTIEIPSGKRVSLSARIMGFETVHFNINAKAGEVITRELKMDFLGTMIDGAVVKGERVRGPGSIGFNMNNVREDPNPIGGVEGKIKTLVGSRNELTSQYNVRGGNFDENLVYVNDFEINRPFLVRSGQQEGLSFINPDLVNRVEFSVGGFQAKYGDKMSSVLDVQYKRPSKLAGSAMASLLGFQAHVEGASKNNKLSFMVGFRQKTNQYLLQSQPTKGQYNPSFTDIQALLNYRFSKKLELEFIGNYALNKFNFTPEELRTTFGSATQAMAFEARYNGQEVSSFDNSFAGISLNYAPTSNLKLKLLASTFESFEKETFDIQSMYALSEVEINLGSENIGETKYSLGSGAIHRYARNFLSANVANLGFKGSYRTGAHFFTFGSNWQYVQIEDRMMEWERRDSAGFSVPYDPMQVNMYKFYQADNAIKYNKLDAYVQDNILLSEKIDAVLTLGMRGTYNTMNEEMIWSPRANFSFRPRKRTDAHRDLIFKLAGGLYAQPPFYREMRAMNGVLNTNLKAQKSAHFAAGMDYNFVALNNRPFKLTAELFYKNLWDLVPYDYDNVRIRYAANNDGIGYAYGGEVRLFGDLVKDAESWISIGYLKTMERIYDHSSGSYGDYQPRPTDGRVTFGMFFSDYLPQNNNFKVFLNLMYATGLPSPLPGDEFERLNNFRIPDYKRVDIGFSALLLDAAKNRPGSYSFFRGVKSVWASFEVFNIMAFANTLSYEYIESLNTNYSFFIPNRLTNRLLNVKLAVRF